jgi:hypothetical protein
LSIICKARVKRKHKKKNYQRKCKKPLKSTPDSKNEKSNANIVGGGTKLRSVVSKI